MTATAKASAWDELERHRRAVVDAEQHVEALEAERRKVTTEHRRLRQAELDYLEAVEAGQREPDEAVERELRQAVVDFEARLTMRPQNGPRGARLELEPVDARLEARLTGARAALDGRRRALDEFMRRQFARLAAELAVEAQAARDEVAAALPPLMDAEARYRRVRARWRPILQANSRPFDLPPNPLRGFADDVDGWAGIPVPIPPDFLDED